MSDQLEACSKSRGWFGVFMCGVVILGLLEGGSVTVRPADGCVLLVARRSHSSAVDVGQGAVDHCD